MLHSNHIIRIYNFYFIKIKTKYLLIFLSINFLIFFFFETLFVKNLSMNNTLKSGGNTLGGTK